MLRLHMNRREITYCGVGDITHYLYPDGEKILGGASLNSAIWARELGARASVVAAVGTDSIGGWFLSDMRARGIDTCIQVLDGVTSTIEISLQNGERTFLHWDPGVLTSYHLTQKEYGFLSDQTIAALTIYDKTLHLLPEFTTQWPENIPKPTRVVNFDDLSHFDKSVDIVREVVHDLDIAFFGLDPDVDAHIIDELMSLAVQTKKLFVITLGAHGSIATDGFKFFTQEAVDADVIDTTGAGDAFLAAFMISWKQSDSIAEALFNGATTAAAAVSTLGAHA